MARIKKGDHVYVLSGKNKGKTGKVLQIWPSGEEALVERVNLVKHFDRRGQQQNQTGGIVEREAPLALSKLTLFCQKCNRPSRVGWLVSGGGEKQRICRRCQSTL